MLFIGTKRQAQETIREEAMRCGMPYVTERWLGGMITNWSTIFLRIQELERLEKMRDTGEINRLTKKEGLLIPRDHPPRNPPERRAQDEEGARPGVRGGRDARSNRRARSQPEGHPGHRPGRHQLRPRGVDYIIPSNDDAIRAIKLLVAKVADACSEGQAYRKESGAAKCYAKRPSFPSPWQPPAAVLRWRLRMTDKDLLGESTLAKMGGKKIEDIEEIVQKEE